ncbi:MAG: NUDIX domain-containing protein [Patescibacteria group bacterium]
MSDQYIRKVQTSVTNFLYCGDDYLFLRRNSTKKIDPNRLNGIGGRLDRGENYLEAAIRETEEETGYKVTADDIELAGIVKLEGGYDEDWIMGFFKIKVSSKKIPMGTKTNDGDLIWIQKDEVLTSGYELVDDLNYCFKDIVEGSKTFFITLQLNKDEKVIQSSISTLKKV